MVRMPVEVADELSRAASERQVSVSEHAAQLLTSALRLCDAA